jgi:hypothetical protein
VAALRGRQEAEKDGVRAEVALVQQQLDAARKACCGMA